jgi:hypothetical protein
MRKSTRIVLGIDVIAVLVGGLTWRETHRPYRGPCSLNVAVDVDGFGAPDYTGIARYTRDDGTGDQYYSPDCADVSRAK